MASRAMDSGTETMSPLRLMPSTVLPRLRSMQAFAIVLLLRAEERIEQEVAQRVFVFDGVEQLRVDARRAALVAGVLVRACRPRRASSPWRAWRRRAG